MTSNRLILMLSLVRAANFYTITRGAKGILILSLGAHTPCPSGNYQLCQLMPLRLIPTKRLVFQFYSRKPMRLAAPIFLLLLFGSKMTLPFSNPTLFYRVTLAAQPIFYAAVLVGGYLLKKNRRMRLLTFAYVFSMMNAAALVGLLHSC